MNRLKQINGQSKASPTANAPPTTLISSSTFKHPPSSSATAASPPLIPSTLKSPPPAPSERRVTSSSISVGGKTIRGIPRALSAKIQFYRDDGHARGELISRARTMKKAKEEEEEAIRMAKRMISIDFCTVNKKVLNPQGTDHQQASHGWFPYPDGALFIRTSISGCSTSRAWTRGQAEA